MRGHASLPLLFVAAILAVTVLLVPARSAPPRTAYPPPGAGAPAARAEEAPAEAQPAAPVEADPTGAGEIDDEAWAAAARRVWALAAAYPGRVGVRVEDLGTGRTIRRDADRAFPSASLAKIPVMIAVEAAVERGGVSLDDRLVVRAHRKAGGAGVLRARPNGSTVTVAEALDLMITRSDNTATNLLVDLVGREAVNEAARALGCRSTVMVRDVMDLRARNRGVENRTTADDLARMLEAIWRGEAVSPAASERMLRRLLAQEVNDRIPALLPEEIPVAHKTGLMKNVVADAGIVWLPGGRPVVVSVLVERRTSFRQAKRVIAEIARAVYDASL